MPSLLLSGLVTSFYLVETSADLMSFPSAVASRWFSPLCHCHIWPKGVSGRDRRA